MTREWMLFIGSLVMLLVGGLLVWAGRRSFNNPNDVNGAAKLVPGIILCFIGAIFVWNSFYELAQTLPSGKVEEVSK